MRKRRRNRPSYGQGYARNRAEAAYPGLRDGLVFNWHGPLGPTGLKAKDTSGYGNDGTLTNMDPATDWVMTPVGYALEFDGTDDYILMPAVCCSDLQTFTVAMCIKTPASFNATDMLCERSNDIITNGWEIALRSGRLAFAYNDGAIRGWYSSVSTLSVNTWYSVTITRNKSSGLIQYYYDGIYQDSDSGTTGTIINNAATQFDVGAKFSAGTNSLWSGSVAICSIWDKVLLPNKIQLLYRDPHAIVRLKQQVFFASAGAPPSFAGSNLILGGGVL